MNEYTGVNRPDKPTAYEGPNEFNYIFPSDRHFEELLHSIFDLRIQHEPELGKQFTDALLPTGVGERGQDVILVNGDLRAGLIQCKMVSTNLTKPTCAKEIIKFGIHAVLDETIISPENTPFTYYLAVAKGFTNPAVELLSSFSSRILSEKEYEEWVNQVLNDYEGFKKKKLTYDTISKPLAKILTRLQVKPIVPSQLDLWVSNYPQLIPRFFRVKIVEVGPIPQATYRSTMTTELISERFRAASSTVRNYPSSFGNLNYHIDRAETRDLLTWIKEPLKEIKPPSGSTSQYAPPVAVLAGDAGYGKTVVIHDLLAQLDEESIPTLAIKADKSNFSRQQEIVSELQLGDDPVKQAYSLADRYERVVILVDQLDALSQHLSANREPLKMYNRLIDQLATVPKVRLIISCRHFDLRYDPGLVQYQDKHVVELKQLSREDVESVFKHLLLSPKVLTKPLYELLSVPLHLNVFCKVHRQVTDLTQLRSVQDLYHELWKQKITTATTQADTVDSKCVVKLVRLIAIKMNKLQQIHVAYRPFETDYAHELSYLRSEGILTVEGTELQFLHQSFFDYVYARTFVDEGGNLAEEIAGTSQHPKHQGLFVRSKVRQILLYLREVDPQTYQQQVRLILSSPTYRFHIKLLVLQSLAFQSDPTPAEQRLVQHVVFNEAVLRNAFLESVSAAVWLDFLREQSMLQPLLQTDYLVAKATLYPLCNRVGANNQRAVIDFLVSLPEFPERYDFVAHVLFAAEQFEDVRTTQLVEELRAKQPLGDLYFYHILEHALSRFPDWVSQQVWLRLSAELTAIKIKSTSEDYIQGDRHDLISLMKKLYKVAPELAIKLALRIIKTLVKRTRLKLRRKPSHDLYGDLAFALYSPDREYSRYTHHELDGNLRDWLTELELTNPTFVRKTVESLLHDKAISQISIGLSVVRAHPKAYAQLFFDLLIIDNFLNYFSEIPDQRFKYSVREALRLCFPQFTPEQQQLIANLIAGVKPGDEGRLYRYEFLGEQVYKHPVGLAQYELLIVLPTDFVAANSVLNSKQKELTRRFESVQHEAPSELGLRAAPILPERAYIYMNDEQWIKSFIKHDERKGNHWDRVSELNHSQRFAEEVKKAPDRFVALIDRIIDHVEVPPTYINCGLDGLAEGEYDPEVVKRLLLRAVKRTDDAYFQFRLIRITNYLLKNNLYDEDVFAYLQHCILHGSQEDRNDGQWLERGVNQPRGAAAGSLVQYAKRRVYTERVFETLEKAIDKASLTTRAAIVYYHIPLNRYNKQRNLNLFLQLCTGYEGELARVAVQSVQYHIHTEFKPLIPFFKKAIIAQDAVNSLTQILTVAYVFNYPGSEQLLDTYLMLSSETVANAVRFALDYLSASNNNLGQRGLTLARRFLNDDRTEVVRAYRHGFDNLTVAHFPYVREFLYDYVKSKVGRYRDGDFYEYLLKCVQKYPDDCLELVAYFENHEGPDITHRKLDKEPLDLIIQAYNTYKKYDEPEKNLDLAMDLFDRILQVPAYRQEARKAAEDI